MIAVAIAAILLTLALPSWQDQVRRSRRSDAMDALATLQQAQERWRGNQPSYAGTLASLGVAAASAGGYYTLAIVSADGDGYELSATAVSGSSQAGDTGCATLTLSAQGGALTTAPAACWRK